MTPAPQRPVTLFLSGDVMTGRGVDQILPHPGSPRLWETYTHDARAYVALAEAVSGAIPRPVAVSWPWGDALDVLDEAAPDLRVINLETSITRSDDVAADKGVHYRMSPANIGCLSVARTDVCALANNHVLDFGPRGLADTCEALAAAGIRTAGAGQDVDGARRAAIVAGEGGRVIVFSLGHRSSGIPDDWAATGERAGVNLAPGAGAIGTLVDEMAAVKEPGDILVVSVHWGSNWGFSVPAGHVDLAHRLVDAGVDIVHGHSSHHVRPIELYRGKLVLYGCGDLINDYEGIGGYEEFRSDIRMLYLATLDRGAGTLARLSLVPMLSRQMRLRRAPADDVEAACALMNRISGDLGARFERGPDGTLRLGG